jgi:predicted nucleic acid-binding protein
MPIKIQAYLDNNVVSALAKDDTADESDGIDQLLVAYDRGEVDLVTSELTLEEIKRYSGRGRTMVERTFRLLEKIPVVRWDELRGLHSYGDARTWITSPLIQNDFLYDGLLKLGLEVMDARHLFVCARQGYGVFLTCDRGVLARASDIQQLSGVIAQRPSELVATQGW